MPDRAEHISHLRRAVARIESSPRRESARALPLTRALDARLGGGLSGDGLHEIAPAAPADAPAAFGFALALAARFMAQSGAAGAISCSPSPDRPPPSLTSSARVSDSGRARSWRGPLWMRATARRRCAISILSPADIRLASCSLFVLA